ncbi:acetyltransferase [Luxibacter massiliensis]|uniref:acetyltransferase n=1 Tax=Luxibacter massiliensis TaxID=2219695 RepID=UPI001F262737|nr:acetyltransferase [Luxibacter massiliensis]
MSNMKKKLLLIGGGGHCKSILDTLYRCDGYHDIGIIEQKLCVGYKVLDTPVIGTDDDLVSLLRDGYTDAFISVGSIGDPTLRKKLHKKISDIGFFIPNIIDSSSYIGLDCQLGCGIFIGKNVVINASVTIGDAAIINTGAVIEHDCQIGDFVHIAPRAIICGDVCIGNNSHIGANSTIIQGTKIGNNVIIGISSAVVKSVPDFQKYCGVPARMMKE